MLLTADNAVKCIKPLQNAANAVKCSKTQRAVNGAN